MHLAGLDMNSVSAARPHTERDHRPEDQSIATDWLESRYLLEVQENEQTG